MMIDNEKDVDRSLTLQMRRFGKIYKIENSAFNGMPDFYYADFRKVAWIENKVIKSALKKVSFRAGQVPFLLANWGVAETWIIVYNKNNKCYYVFKGTEAKNLQDHQFDSLIENCSFINHNISEVSKWLKNFTKN